MSNKKIKIIIGGVLFVLILLVGFYVYIKPNTPDYYLFEKIDTENQTGGNKINAKIFFVALDDKGKQGKKIGCDDSIVPVWVTASSSSPLRSVLETLLSQKDQFVTDGALMNSLYASSLSIQSVSIDASGIARMYLKGSMSLGGVCDSPRFKAQIEETALQFGTVKKVEIYINGASLDALLSEKGDE